MKDHYPTVSAIIPVYNSANWIQDAIDSIYAQDYPVVEIIVVDDGSSDSSAALAAEKGAKLIIQDHKGVSAARNAAIKESKGEYIAFLDADDLWTDGSLAKRMELFKKDKEVGLVFGDLELRDAITSNCIGWFFDDRPEFSEMKRETILDNAYVIKCDPIPYLLRRPFIGIMGTIVPRYVFDEVGGFDESMNIAEDVDLWLRIARRYPIAYTASTVAVYRRHPESTTSNKKLVTFGLVDAWRKFNQLYSDKYPQLRELFMNNLGSYAYEAGLIKMADRDMAAARKYFATGIKYMPGYKSAWLKYISTFIRFW